MLIEKIKADLLHARKARLIGTVSALTTLVGEAEMIGKNAGDRASTDDEVLAVIKKFVKNIDETLQHIKTDDPRFAALSAERVIYAVYLPTLLSAEQICEILTKNLSHLPANKAAYMKFLKENHAGQYDGKIASAVVDELMSLQ